MSTNDTDDPIADSLEDHERALKQVLESLGVLEDQFAAVTRDMTEDDQAPLEQVGRALEQHISHLEDLVQTLDDHKRVVRETSGEQSDVLAAAIERSRRRARHEPTPPSGSDDE